MKSLWFALVGKRKTIAVVVNFNLYFFGRCPLCPWSHGYTMSRDPIDRYNGRIYQARHRASFETPCQDVLLPYTLSSFKFSDCCAYKRYDLLCGRRFSSNAGSSLRYVIREPIQTLGVNKTFTDHQSQHANMLDQFKRLVICHTVWFNYCRTRKFGDLF